MIAADQDKKRAELGLTSLKKKISVQEKIAQLKARDQELDNLQVIDPYTVKVRKIYKDVTEEELLAILQQFGEVTRVKIPTDENGDYRGLAFATFKKTEDCT